MDTQYKIKNAGCYHYQTPHDTSATWQQLSRLPAYSSCSTRAIQKSLTLNKKIFESSGKNKSQANGPLALLPAPKCLQPSFYSDAYLNFSSSTWVVHLLLFYLLQLATVQNWMLVALEKASLHFVNSLQLSKVCPTSILQPVQSLKWRQMIMWYKSGTVIGWQPLCRAAVRLCE